MRNKKRGVGEKCCKYVNPSIFAWQCHTLQLIERLKKEINANNFKWNSKPEPTNGSAACRQFNIDFTLSWSNFQLFNSIIQWFRVIWLHNISMPSILNGSKINFDANCKYRGWGKILNSRLQTKIHFDSEHSKGIMT